MVVLNIEMVGGESEFPDKLRAMADRAMDMAPAFGAVIESFHYMESQRFAMSGPGWQGLSTTTSQYKAEHGFSGAILVRTQQLIKSLTGDGGTAVTEITPDSVTMGTSDIIGLYHQEGASAGTWTLPQRKVVEVTPDAVAVWLQIIGDYFAFGITEVPHFTGVV